jgi:hypothetical protein
MGDLNMGSSETGMDPLQRKPFQKTCERCGGAFPCGASGVACWCDSLKLGAGALAQLRAAYRDCLCPQCLPSFAESKPTP